MSDDTLALQQNNVAIHWLAHLICILEVSGLNPTHLPFTEYFGTVNLSVKTNSNIVCQILGQI